MATICNATIHKYLFVADLVGQNDFKIRKIYIHLLMFFVQIPWPLIGIIITLNANFQPASVIEKGKAVSFEGNAFLELE
jgi:hypothetical protein